MAEGFWNDKKSSEKVIKEMNSLKEIVGEFSGLQESLEEVEVLIDFIESGEEEFASELTEKIKLLGTSIEVYDTKLLLDGEYDSNNAIVTIHAGAGGTESCDWAEMLYRMYSRWCNEKKYKLTELDFMPGDMVGIKSITFMVEGPRSYGYLKSEKGVHRLVRISPFDAAKKRHTSFASIDVMPEVDDTTELEINTGDLKIDTYRASGAGGQHVNVTDSAVRITHMPSGIIVQCQDERSQILNKQIAMQILGSRLFELEQEKNRAEIEKLRGEKKEIGWGNQIRSYVMMPYQLVKDHRSQVEVGDVNSVLDGGIEPFIRGFLEKKLARE